MLKLVLCDDDQFTLSMLCASLEKAIQISKIEARIVCRASAGKELMQFLSAAPGSYLYFLDFDLGKERLNGIDLVKQIYTVDADAKIIFVTSHSDKGLDILRSGIRPFGFMEKTMDQRKMVSEYIRYLQMAAPDGVPGGEVRTIEVPIDLDETVTLNVEDILYVDSVKSVAHSICYHTFDGSEITVRDTLDRVQEVLGPDYIRTHRSVLVNRKGIIGYQDGQVKLANGSLAACAMSKRKQIQAYCIQREKGI